MTRSGTFTMVLDPKFPIGQAFVVPGRSRLHTFDDLLLEAEALWRAERNKQMGSGISASWGCVGALFSRDVSESVRQRWSEHFRARATSVDPVDSQGNLKLDWPRRRSDDSKVDFDVILATATRPESSPAPTEEIARAWAEQTEGEERYFLENIRSGIRTSCDRSIWNHLLEMEPVWLDHDLRLEMNEYLAPHD